MLIFLGILFVGWIWVLWRLFLLCCLAVAFVALACAWFFVGLIRMLTGAAGALTRSGGR